MKNPLVESYSSNLWVRRDFASALIIAFATLVITLLIEIDQISKFKSEVKKLEKKEMVLTEGGCYQVEIKNKKVSFKER